MSYNTMVRAIQNLMVLEAPCASGDRRVRLFGEGGGPALRAGALSADLTEKASGHERIPRSVRPTTPLARGPRTGPTRLRSAPSGSATRPAAL